MELFLFGWGERWGQKSIHSHDLRISKRCMLPNNLVKTTGVFIIKSSPSQASRLCCLHTAAVGHYAPSGVCRVFQEASRRDCLKTISGQDWQAWKCSNFHTVLKHQRYPYQELCSSSAVVLSRKSLSFIHSSLRNLVLNKQTILDFWFFRHHWTNRKISSFSL